MGNYKDAYDNELLYRNLLDTINSAETAKKITELKMNSEFQKKDAIAKIEQNKKDALAEQEIQKQNNLRNSLFVGFALMILLAVVSFRSFRRKQKDNQVIIKQKELVENKNKEITKSIQYALRIQNAILPPPKSVSLSFNNSFIVYKPKDIVAGDFYWMEANEDLILFAACDCTGHGVPGAMVSVVCHNALNRAVREFGLTKPSKILDKTAAIVIENFSKSEDEIRDGMDISLCSFNKKTNTLEWAGANNPLWRIVNGEILETKGDKQPIGTHENYHSFTNHTFTLNSGDSIYLFTDGYSDQFGEVDEKQKKLKRKRFKDLLLSIHKQPMLEQGVSLDNFITEYRNDIEQIDDILVMGVRV